MRKELYERGLEEEVVLQEDIRRKEQANAEVCRERNEQEIVRKHEDYQAVKQAYSAVEQQASSESVGMLLLLSVPTHPLADINDGDHGTDAVKIKEVVKERDDALTLAKVYRDLAEHLKKEKRELHNRKSHRCETIRNCWRGKLVEAGSRSGLLVQRAIQKRLRKTSIL